MLGFSIKAVYEGMGYKTRVPACLQPTNTVSTGVHWTGQTLGGTGGRSDGVGQRSSPIGISGLCFP